MKKRIGTFDEFVNESKKSKISESDIDLILRKMSINKLRYTEKWEEEKDIANEIALLLNKPKNKMKYFQL